jgi:uncharacterized protein
MNREVTVIVKVTNACNMACRYCFIEPSVFHKTMTADTARHVVRAFLDSRGFESVHFVWHGGEPLLRGLAFFRDLLGEERRLPTRVAYTNSIQTNATLLDDEALAFLLRNDFAIGLSLDGPPSLNDPSRPMRKGPPVSAHEVTLRAADRLRAAGQAPAAIVVVNRANVDHPERVYGEFKARAIDLKLTPLAASGLAAADAAGTAITAEAYGSFLARIFDAWFDDPAPSISIEPIRQHIGRILGVPGVVQACHFTRSCHRSFLGIAPDGEVYPCGMFQGEPAFRYGNIRTMAPERVAATALFGRIEAREALVLDSCSRCAFLDLCYGGCMFHSLKNGGAFEERSYYCAGYKVYFEHLVRRIHADLRRASGRIGPGLAARARTRRGGAAEAHRE